jgi:hypothetical protein
MNGYYNAHARQIHQFAFLQKLNSQQTNIHVDGTLHEHDSDDAAYKSRLRLFSVFLFRLIILFTYIAKL